MVIVLLFIIPIITGLLCLVPKKRYLIGRIQTLGMFALFLDGLIVVKNILNGNSVYSFKDVIYLDAISGIMIFLISFLSFLSSLYSIAYMVNEIEEKIPSEWKLKGYYFLLNLFILTMLMLVTTNSIGILWISIELTTLVSAFLVGYYNKETPVEAAWKYIVLCTVGIAFAMIGIVLLYYAVTHAGGLREQGLNWNYLITIAHKLDPNLMKVAFVFILIGFGTKAGLAPMHTWLPDAHSEAPTPVSALLSGVLLKCALYGIIRFAILINLAVDSNFTSHLLLFFGLLSIIVATPFILVQKNIKRLLAYSSLEHIGIITTGLAFGNSLSVFGAFIHIINHAIVKSLMFFTAGNISLKFHTKDMDHIKGAAQIVPLSAFALILGGLALAGAPPFSIFISEFYILAGGIKENHLIASGLIIFLLTVIFGGLLYHFLKITIGPINGLTNLSNAQLGRSSNFPVLICLFVIVLLGVSIPSPLFRLVNEAVKIFSMGNTI